MIRYRIDAVDVHAHLYDVTLNIPAPAAHQRLSLPVWIPGSYLVREFARHLQQISASQGALPLALEQLDKCTWLARCSGRGALEVRYRVYAFDASVRTAWLDNQRGFFNGTSLCLRVEGREREPHTLQIGSLPRGWMAATAMSPVKVDARGRGTYSAANYDELVDHPFELGVFWRGRFKAHGVPHEFVVAGAQPGFDGERLLADARRICEAQIALWHGAQGDVGAPATASKPPVIKPPKPPKPPFARYVFLLCATDEGHGGLEHRASTALIAPRRDLPRTDTSSHVPPDGYVQLLGLISHEYFHTWNVKRLKPQPFTAYDYTRENHTDLLWFFEGFTAYYDDLMLARAGLIDEPRYLRLLAKALNQVLGTPGRQVQSVAQASFDAWTRYYRPDENTVNATVSYYTKGSLVALCLDLTLRHEGRSTLDAVLRALWLRSGAANAGVPAAPAGAGGITEADLLAVLQDLGGRSFEPELRSWVHGTDELPVADLVVRFGVTWKRDAPGISQRLGARMADSAGVLKLQSVLRGGAAESAGLAAGDELIAVNGWRVRRADDLLPAGAFAGAADLLAARDQRLLTLRLESALPAPGGAIQLSPMPAPETAAAARRAAWLGSAAR